MKEIIEFLRESQVYDPWARELDFDTICKEIRDEAEEVIEANEKKDYENLKEELGDTISDCILAALVAEKKGLFTLDEVFKGYLAKIKRRKPHVVEKKLIRLKEAKEIWQRVKKEERDLKNIR